MSELIQNLTYIYNEKLLLKDAIGTESDDFMQYHTYVNALKPSGTSYITSNGDYDISSYSYVNVDVEGGGSGNPYDDAVSVADMIMNGDTTADYVSSAIMSDFLSDGGRSNWNETVTIDTGEVDGNDEPIMEEKTVHFDIAVDGPEIATALEDYPDLYGQIFPIVQNVTLEESSDPSNDGYDYILIGELYFWNLNDMNEPVVEITDNGFYPSADSVSLGFNVDVPIPTIASKRAEITANGRYYAQDVDSVDGWSEVTVAVPIPTIASKRAEITANGRYYAQSVDSVDGWSEVTVNVPSSGITPTGKFSNFILKGHDGTVICLYPTQNEANTYADITNNAQLFNIVLESIDAGVDAYDYIEYYFTDRTGSRLSNQSYYPFWNYNNVSNAVIHTSTNFIAGNSGINLYAVQHTVIQDPNWSPNPDMPDEVALMIDTPGTPYQLYLGGEPDIPCVIDGENYYVIYGNGGPFYYNGYMEGYLTVNNGV